MTGEIVERSLLEWQLAAGPVAAIGAAAAIYLLAARRTRRWPARRAAAFLGGLAALALAFLSGLDAHGEELLSVHMTQHLVLTLVAAPLLLLGAPLTLALQTLPSPGRRKLGRALRSRAARVLAHPATGVSVFTAALVGTHASPWYDAALRSEWLHAAEHAVYLLTALLFWLPLVGREPLPRRPGAVGRLVALAVAMPPAMLVGVVLVTMEEVAYPTYVSRARDWGVAALADQAAAGRIMWLAGGIVLATLTVAIVWSALLREERRAQARDRYAERRVAAGGGA